MNTLLKIILLVIGIYVGIQIAYYICKVGYTNDSTYILPERKVEPYKDTTNYQRFFIIKDTSKYEGKWVDPQ